MKIVVDPEWTFIEAVNAAWKAYPGGKQYGVPNRIRVLEQWANVVGKERAENELSTIVAENSGIKTTAELLGFSEYAIRKLKKSFSKMPFLSLTPNSDSLTLKDFLASIPFISANSEISFTIQVIPKLASLLGYSDNEIFFEVNIGANFRERADVIFAPSGLEHPYIIFEIKGKNKSFNKFFESSLEQIKYYCSLTSSSIGVLIDFEQITIISHDNTSTFNFSNLKEKDIKEIEFKLKKPNSFKLEEKEPLGTTSHNLFTMLKEVENSKTNDEKKKSLESLAAMVFESHHNISCIYKNLRTKSSEIDIVCEIQNIDLNFKLRDHGRYFLVECKNWSKPVGAKEIRDFIVKLQKSRLKLGIYFATNGITGERDGADALREIHSVYDKEELFVVVISHQDLSKLNHFNEVIKVIEQKIEAIKFDF